MPHSAFDPKRTTVFPLSERKNMLFLDDSIPKPPLEGADWTPPSHWNDATLASLDRLEARIRKARRNGSSVMLAYGAHLVKNRLGCVVRGLIEDGWITHIATQGAGVIHDWEFAYQGSTGESVRENAPAGRFGSWDETGRWINLAVLAGAAEGLGFGESIGRMIVRNEVVLPALDELHDQIIEDPSDSLTAARADLLNAMLESCVPSGRHSVEHPHREISILAAAYESGIPATVHPGIGYDIIVNHPMYHGGAIGRAALTDARIYASSVERLDDGVYMSVGSAIMSPQVFEKAFSLVNNARVNEERDPLTSHYLAIVDLQSGGGWDWTQGEPPSDHPAYYLRFCKSFYRMGGTLDYFSCDNHDFLLALALRLKQSS